MYDYSYGYTDPTSSLGILGGLVAMGGIMMLISGIIGIVMIISTWKLYTKAGKPGWASIVPIYNFIVLIQIAGLPLWYIALFFVPFANIYAMFKIYIEIAHKFGKSTGFGVLSVFFSFICIPILAFNKNVVYADGNNNEINNPTPTTQFNPADIIQANNNENIGSNNETPFVFNQNINTQINPIPQVSDMPTVNPEPISEVNAAPEINVVEPTQNILLQPETAVTETPVVEETPNVIPQPVFDVPVTPSVEVAPVQPEAISEVNAAPEINVVEPTQNILLQPETAVTETPVVEETPNVIPQPVFDVPVTPSVEVAPVQPEPIPAVNPEPVPVAIPNAAVSQEPQINVIPGMEQTVAPTENDINNPNNTVM